MAVAPAVVRIEAHFAEQPGDALAPFLLRSNVVDHQRLRNDVANLHARVERGIWILEDDLHFATQLAQFAFAHRRHVAIFKPDLAFRRFDQTKEAATGRRFSAT